MNTLKKEQLQPYIMMFGICFICTIFAFTQQTPKEIAAGLIKINMTRGVLITDFIQIGGIGAAFMNGVIIGSIAIILSIRLKITPTGGTIMSLFLTIGFSMFGNSILNMLPVTFGVWVYSKTVKKPYSDYYTTGLLAATISPITSEIIFLGISSWLISILLGVFLGVLSGFLFPMVSQFAAKVHCGFTLYNMGFVGGMLAVFFAAIMNSIGIIVKPAFFISSGNNFVLGVLLFTISLFLILCGLILGDRKKLFSNLTEIVKQSGASPSDYYSLYGSNIYINMGLLCAIGTTIVLILGAELNGPTIAGILTMTGFGAFGKHIKNVLPLLVGATIATFTNKWNPSYTSNILAILFSTGLAPIAGKYGIFWGVIVGFLHVGINLHVGVLSNGLNLYNNGFTAGFVAILMVPIIEGISKIKLGKE